MGSRPLHGESIYLLDEYVGLCAMYKVLVPSTGNLYIYAEMESVNQPLPQVLVPSTGNLYIYGIVDGERYWITTGSRPLHGESIYLLRGATDVSRSRYRFSSPPRGIYISTYSKNMKMGKITVLVPSTGNLYIYYWMVI